MIARSGAAKVVSLVLATGVIAGAVQLATPRTVIEVEGGGTPVEAKMGSQFEDMVSGTLTAVTPDDTLASEPHAALPQEQMVPPQAQPISPKALELVKPLGDVAQQLTTHTLQPRPQVETLAALPAEPLSTATTSQAAPITPPAPAAVLPEPVAALAARPAPETIVAQAPDSDAPTLSQRPKRKNVELAAKAAETQKKAERARRAEAKPAARKPKPANTARGNAKKNNTKGAQTGSSAKAKASSTGKKKVAAKKSGNAAASNYPGQVMRRISRVGKPRVNARGTATISFSVSSGGGLGGVRVARSSGSSALDQAAIRLIRKAAPFPRPPAGAQRQFSIRIKGR